MPQSDVSMAGRSAERPARADELCAEPGPQVQRWEKSEKHMPVPRSEPGHRSKAPAGRQCKPSGHIDRLFESAELCSKARPTKAWLQEARCKPRPMHRETTDGTETSGRCKRQEIRRLSRTRRHTGHIVLTPAYTASRERVQWMKRTPVSAARPETIFHLSDHENVLTA